MAYIMVDIECDGPIPGNYSMISIGAVIVDMELNKTFYREIRPISENFISESLLITGFNRNETLKFEDPKQVMTDFEKWISQNCNDKPIFISDNNGFDWMFVCWYFYNFLNFNPFGYSSQNLGSFYKGIVRDTFMNFKHLRTTKHTHNALDDAIGNAGALLKIIDKYDVKIKL